MDGKTAELKAAFLGGANLSRAYLGEANLTGAYLSGANLTMTERYGHLVFRFSHLSLLA
jgi:uncharacterized protein YjbI with pentapeptide repeats